MSLYSSLVITKSINWNILIFSLLNSMWGYNNFKASSKIGGKYVLYSKPSLLNNLFYTFCLGKERHLEI